MNGEKLNNQAVNRTAEQIRQGPDYAWLVDALDASFRDNVWTGLDGDKSADKFMEAVFGPEQARVIPQDVKQQFYEDYLFKIQELRQGRVNLDSKTEKPIGGIPKKQVEIDDSKKESTKEFYRDIDKSPEAGKIYDQMVELKSLIPDMPPVPKYSLEYKGWLNNLKDRIAINNTKIRTEQYNSLIEKYNILCQQFLSLFDKGLRAQEIINKIRLEQERKNLIQLQIENEKAILLAKIKENENVIAENQAKIDKIKTSSKGQPIEIKKAIKEGEEEKEKEKGGKNIVEDWEKRKIDLLEKVRNGKKSVDKTPIAADWKKLNQELTDYLGSSFQDIAAKDKPELLDKTVKAIDGLWRYFATNKKWVKAEDKKRNNQKGIYLKDFSDCNAKAVLLLIKKSGLEQSLLNNWDKAGTEPVIPQTLQNNLSAMASQTSSAEVMYHLLQDQGILKNKEEALRLMVGLATKSMHYELVDSKAAWQGSGLSLRGLHRAFNQQQQYVYLKERINNFLELKKWHQPLSKKQQAELDQELLNEPVDKTLAAKLVNNGKQDEMMSRLDRVSKEQLDIINQAKQVLDKSDEELIKNGQLAITGNKERWFINQHKKDDKSFGGAVAAKAYGFDGFINYDEARGGYLAVGFKSDSNLADRINLPGANKVNKQMIMHQGNGQDKVSLEQLLKEVLPDYKPVIKTPDSKTQPFVQLDKEPDKLPDNFEYNGLHFNRVLTEEEITLLRVIDEIIKEYVVEAVSKVIKQKYNHLDPVEKSSLFKEMITEGMNHPKILEQRKNRCFKEKLPLVIDN